jgi:ribonuclease P protein component
MTDGKKLSYSYHQKLHKQADFSRVFKRSVKLENKVIKILVLKLEENRPCRLGLITSRRIGGAVVRNRTKRRLREIFRTNQHFFSNGLDMVFILKQKTTQVPFSQLKKAVLDCLKAGGFYFAPKN